MLTVLMGHFDANSFGKTNVFLRIEGRVEVNPLNFAEYEKQKTRAMILK